MKIRVIVLNTEPTLCHIAVIKSSYKTICKMLKTDSFEILNIEKIPTEVLCVPKDQTMQNFEIGIVIGIDNNRNFINTCIKPETAKKLFLNRDFIKNNKNE
jgi:hypothetical protein